MEIVAVVLLAGLVAGYLVLAGCDIGLGMLMPYVARTGAERRRAVSAMAPYFLGSEVWLLGAIGVTIGLFPAMKSAVIAGLWPAFVALLAGWLFRDAGLWMRPRMGGRAGRAVCDAWIVAGSWVLALSWGLVIAGLLGDGRLLSPFSVACALASAALFALRGAAFGAERLVPAVPVGTGGAEEARAAVGLETSTAGAAGAPATGRKEAAARMTGRPEAGAGTPAHPGVAAGTAAAPGAGAPTAEPGGRVPGAPSGFEDRSGRLPNGGGSAESRTESVGPAEGRMDHGTGHGSASAPGPAGSRIEHGDGRAPAGTRGAVAAVDSAEAADAAARVTRPLARTALAAAVLAAGASLLPGGAVLDRPLAAAAAAFVLVGALAATSGLSGPQLSRHTSALTMALIPVLIAAAVNLPVAPVPDGTALLFWSAMLPVVPFMVVGQFWLYRMLRRPAPTTGFFA